MYSVVTSMKRAPTSARRRASRQPRPKRPTICCSYFAPKRSRRGVGTSVRARSLGTYLRTCSIGSIDRSNALRRRRAEQAMGVVVGAQQRLLLIRAAVLGRSGSRSISFCRTRCDSRSVPGDHAAWRTHAVRGLLGKRDVERPVLAAEKTGGGERLQLLGFADVHALADVDERGHGRIRAVRACARRSRRGAAPPPSAAARSRCATDTDAASAG